MHPTTDPVQVKVTEGVVIDAQVMSYELNPVDNLYHYNLQAQFGDGNTQATVLLNDVVENLLIIKE